MNPAIYQDAYNDPWRPDADLVEMYSSPRDHAERRLMERALQTDRYDNYTDDQWEGAALMELSRDKALPEDYRRDAWALGNELVKGYKAHTAASRIGISRGRVNSLMTSRGKALMTTPESIAKVGALLESGLTRRQAAEKLGMTHYQVINLAKHYAAGVKTK